MVFYISKNNFLCIFIQTDFLFITLSHLASHPFQFHSINKNLKIYSLVLDLKERSVECPQSDYWLPCMSILSPSRGTQSIYSSGCISGHWLSDELPITWLESLPDHWSHSLTTGQSAGSATLPAPYQSPCKEAVAAGLEGVDGGGGGDSFAKILGSYLPWKNTTCCSSHQFEPCQPGKCWVYNF